MAVRIAPIFESVLADDRVAGSERAFVESLRAYYLKNRSLTPGRRRALAKIATRLKEAPTKIDPSMLANIENVILRSAAAKDDWACKFAGSIRGQLASGRDLSERQTEIWHKIMARHSDEAMAKKTEWFDTFDDDRRSKLKIAIDYYRANRPYFSHVVERYDADNTHIPDERTYKKLTENNHIAKVFANHFANPAYTVGQTVARRRASRRTLGVVLAADAAPITSACRGAKKYLVLFYGSVSPILIEERHIKKGLTKKNKKS